jgi:hypothetical protein
VAEEPVFVAVGRTHVCGPTIHGLEVLGAFDAGILVWVRLSYSYGGSLRRGGCWLLSWTSETYVLLEPSKEASDVSILLRSRRKS